MATKAKRSKTTTRKSATKPSKTARSKTARSGKSAARSSASNGSRSNGGLRRWDASEDKALKQLIKQNTPTRLIAMKLKRTEGSVRQHVQKLGLSLKPTNRSPYG